MVHLLREWYLPSTGLHPIKIHHLLAQPYLASQSPTPGIDIHFCQLYSPAITISTPQSIPQKLPIQNSKKFKIYQQERVGLSSLKKREREREWKAHSPSQKVANKRIQINSNEKLSTSSLHTLQISHVPWDLNLAKYQPRYGSPFSWAIQVTKVCKHLPTHNSTYQL